MPTVPAIYAKQNVFACPLCKLTCSSPFTNWNKDTKMHVLSHRPRRRSAERENEKFIRFDSCKINVFESSNSTLFFHRFDVAVAASGSTMYRLALRTAAAVYRIRCGKCGREDVSRKADGRKIRTRIRRITCFLVFFSLRILNVKLTIYT